MESQLSNLGWGHSDIRSTYYGENPAQNDASGLEEVEVAWVSHLRVVAL